MAAPCESATGATHVAIAYKKRRMLIYLLFLLPPLVLAWARPPVKRRITFVAVAYFVALLLFMGLRDRTGPDWDAYIYIYEDINSDLGGKDRAAVHLSQCTIWYAWLLRIWR